MDVWTRMLMWHTGLVLRRANRRRRRILQRELAAYSSAELVDLEAALERYPLGQTQELRSMLAGQRLQQAWTRHSPAA